MEKRVNPQCGRCKRKDCRDVKDCFLQADIHRHLYRDSQLAELHQAAAAIEGQYYGKEPRLSETMLFALELGYEKIGLAFCIGLSEEAKLIEVIFSQHFEVVSVFLK